MLEKNEANHVFVFWIATAFGFAMTLVGFSVLSLGIVVIMNRSKLFLACLAGIAL